MLNYSPLEFEILRWLKENHDRIPGISLDKIREEVAEKVPHEEQVFLNTLRWLNVEELILFSFNSTTRIVSIEIKKDGLTALRHAPVA